MKNIRYKLTLAMLATTISLFALVILLINYYQQNYIFNGVQAALQNEARFYDDYQAYIEAVEDEGRFFDVNFVFIDPAYQSNQLTDDYFTREENYFNRLYRQGELNYDEIEHFDTDFGNYFAMLIEIDDPIIVDDFNGVAGRPDDFLENNRQSIPAVLYVDVSGPTNIINNLNTIFAFIFLLAVLIEGVVGIYLGSRLEDSERKLKHFFQNASHELKTPLMSIQGYTEGLKTGVVENRAEALDVILKQSNKMHRLIDEILNISKLDSSGYRLKREAVNLYDIVEAAIDDHQLAAKKSQVAIDFKSDEGDYNLVGDSLQLYKAINTIVNNAVKFAKSSVKLQLTKQANRLALTVYNDGQPIAPKDLPHIFDRFYSGNWSGSGIGLAMAKQIIRLSKGQITVQNQSDGVLFKIALPIKK